LWRLLLNADYPDALVLVEFVVGHEHPPELTNKFNCLKNILNIFIVEEPRKVYARVAQPEHLMTIEQHFFELTRQLKVQAKHLLTIWSSATTTRPWLDAENVIEKHGYKVGVQKLAEACFNDKTENWNFLQIVIAKQEQVINRKKSLYWLFKDLLLQLVDGFYPDLIF
jgi:hypothetical protein